MYRLKKSILVDQISILDTSDVISSKAYLFQISNTGFYLYLNRKHLSQNFRKNLSLNNIHKKDIVIHLKQMNIDLDGTITNTMHLGRGVFEMQVQFFEHVPEYWSDCLLDMCKNYPDGEWSRHPLTTIFYS